jgi:hypothetical protein
MHKIQWKFYYAKKNDIKENEIDVQGGDMH